MAVPRGLAIKARQLSAAGMPDRQIAREIRLSRTVCQRLREQATERLPRQAEPEFVPKKVQAYYCAGCERIVLLRPCVACAARAARLA